jgi:anti-sigma regulatory factor (Ser/Thr protein kinase)
MATVRLEISPTPAHVRTARLVAAAVARRSGIDEALLDEIRLAVGEACSRAVGLHRIHAPNVLVRLDLTDGPRFTVVVTDAISDELAPADLTLAAAAVPDPVALVAASSAGTGTAEDAELAEDSIAAGVGLALLAGLVDDLVIDHAPRTGHGQVSETGSGTKSGTVRVTSRPGEFSLAAGTSVRMSWPLHGLPRSQR